MKAGESTARDEIIIEFTQLNKQDCLLSKLKNWPETEEKQALKHTRAILSQMEEKEHAWVHEFSLSTQSLNIDEESFTASIMIASSASSIEVE